MKTSSGPLRRPGARRWAAIGAVALSTVVAVAASPVSTAAAAGPNILTNPSCDSGTSGWSGYQASLTASTTVKRSGTASCRVASTGSGIFSLQSTQSSPNPQVGQTFTGSAWVRADTANGRDVYLALRERGGATPSRTVYGAVAHLSAQWQQITASITVTATGRSALDFYVPEDPGGSGHVFYADDLAFQAASGSPSGQPMPVGNLTGWRQIFAEDFTKDSATGSWGASCATDPDAANKIVYTGSGGTPWRTYPDCYLDTGPKRPYRSDQVLSTHDGQLDFYLHNVGGKPAGASPSPVIDVAAMSNYQTYGRYSYRSKLDTHALSEYKVAWLLWPSDDKDYRCAESDFPEAGLAAGSVDAFAHYGCAGAQDQYSATIDFTQWHTFTQEWAPGVRRYYLDGTLIGTSTNAVFAKPERLQLQTETTADGTHTGHLLVDWVVAYAYQP